MVTHPMARALGFVRYVNYEKQMVLTMPQGFQFEAQACKGGGLMQNESAIRFSCLLVNTFARFL